MRQLQRGKIVQAALAFAVVSWVGLVGAAAAARLLLPALPIAGVLTVTILHPYLTAQQARRLIPGTVTVVGVACAYTYVYGAATGLPWQIEGSVIVITIMVVLAMVMVLLTQHHARMEGHLHQLQQSLVETAAAHAREARLMQEKADLEVARQVALQAAQTKASFLSNMSHEIRTPMNAIIGMTSILLDTPLTAEQQEAAGVIHTSSAHLLGLITDILDYTKIEAGHIDLEQVAFSPRACIEEALDLVAQAAAEKQIALCYWIDEPMPETVIGDPGRLRQVLLNLLSNAVKFTPEHGEVVVQASALALSPDRGRHGLAFAVSDTGIGIAPEVVPHLFHPFTQADASTTRRFGGTGLGLSICKRLCELMGGNVEVHTEVGQGSTFRCTIQASLPGPSARSAPRAAPAELRGRQVLIIDAHQRHRQILERYTARWGLVTRATAHPQEALTWVAQGEPFDLALLDHEMPDVDGLTLAHTLRQLRPGGPPAIILMGTMDEAMATKLAVAHVPKPIKPARLLSLIEAALAHIRHTPPAAPGIFPTSDTLGDRHPLRILLVEDNPINQTVAKRMLAKLGYVADIAADGIEALQAVQRQPYDLVFMDIQMPRMDGIAASREICRGLQSEHRPRIVGMTASVEVEDRVACAQAGMSDYIAKPVTVERLIQTLQQTSRQSDTRDAKP